MQFYNFTITENKSILFTNHQNRISFPYFCVKTITIMKNFLLLIMLFSFSLTAQIEAEWAGSGTAFAINSNGYFATNNHVIQNVDLEKNAKVIFLRVQIGDDVYVLNVDIVAQDIENDLAILKTKNSIYLGELPYSFRKNEIELAEDIYTLGYPIIDINGLDIKFSNGKVSAKSGEHGDPRMYLANLNLDHGNSGGPVLNKDCQVIGVATAGMMTDNSINNYIVKSEYLFNLAQQFNIPLNTSSSAHKNLEVSKQVKHVKSTVYTVMAISDAKVFEDMFKIPFEELVDVVPPTKIGSNQPTQDNVAPRKSKPAPKKPKVEKPITPEDEWHTLPKIVDITKLRYLENWEKAMLETFESENTNVVVVSKTGLEMDRFTIKDYINRLNILENYKVEIHDFENNAEGQITKLFVTEQRLK